MEAKNLLDARIEQIDELSKLYGKMEYLMKQAVKVQKEIKIIEDQIKLSGDSKETN